ncbi:S10 family peptidase [Streptomyces sp. UNOB3_S3]|uniref:S10 family peptidase n=1 Tax=Streptomyces sp. UNOB3_S3 TaxID=2871682 RepID=UPI001E2B0E33|nr:S10 family peptidase [Streptomyces sp. UNOB3_S3]MCC3774603.1 S10 family peptidase [Streptomyces sp. UNOB3_S3]
MPSDRVTSIPANVLNTQSIDLKTRSYAGHVDIDSREHPGTKDHLFYWFFESQTCNPHVAVHDQQELISETPLLIWLNGGPGASSLLGLFLENGPLSIGTDAAGTISVASTSWNQQAHVVYWDQPIGTGYSYSDAKEYVRSEEALARMFWEGLQEFFGLHPEYAQCPLYVCGESYAGKYVPAIAREIDKRNHQEGSGQHINLRGIAVGNGWIKPELSLTVLIDYACTTGFLGIGQRDSLYDAYGVFKKALDASDMKLATKLGNDLVAKVQAYGGNFDLYDVRRWDDLPMGALAAYLNSKHVKKSLNVPTDIPWQSADDDGPVAKALVDDNMADRSGWYTEILDKGYKTLLYTGNFDTACGYRSTEEILDDLMRQKGAHEHAAWRNAPRIVWTQAQGDPKGFVRHLGSLTQVSVPGSGHQVPAFQPEVCREMLYTWLFDRPFHGYDPQQPLKPRNGGSR